MGMRPVWRWRAVNPDEQDHVGPRDKERNVRLTGEEGAVGDDHNVRLCVLLQVEQSLEAVDGHMDLNRPYLPCRLNVVQVVLLE